MPGNPREMLKIAEQRFAGPHQDCRSPKRVSAGGIANYRLARRELRGGRLGDDTLGNSRGAE
jgi:hypothetical protein